MKYNSALWNWSRGWSALGLAALLVGATGCVEPDTGGDPDDFFGEGGSEVTASDPVEFTDEPYDEVSGDMTIEDLRSYIPDEDDEVIWYGFGSSDPYPVEGDCDPERDFDETIPEEIDELPVRISGVVTLHPRYFESGTVCGSDQRYQGTYILEDETGGIQILKDSRVADVDVGDHVELRVRGITRNFGTVGVLAFDQEQALTDRDDPVPIFYEALEREFEEDDEYRVRRVTGEVVLEPTNQNFNEMRIQSLDDDDVEWTASLDRELGNRGVGPKLGDTVELTGPVHPGFDDREIIVATLGQMDWIERADDEQQQ